MCAQNQFEISDLARMVHPSGKGHRTVAVLSFKFDESYDGRFLSIGGWLGEESEWMRLETSWQNLIDKLNSQNGPHQQITRFHAVYMNRLEKEFENWDDIMSAAFAHKLTGFLAKRRMIAITVGADMDALIEVFPGSKKTKKMDAYTLPIKIAMIEVAHQMTKHFPRDQVLFVHDHGNWDAQAVGAYSAMVDDPRWINRGKFVGITSLTGKQSVGLQAADLIAFEANSTLRKKLFYNSEEPRKPIVALQSKGAAIVGTYMNKEAAIAFRDAIEEDDGIFPTRYG